MVEQYTYNDSFTLESGATLPSLQLGYTVLGDLASGKKIVWVFHALTASSDPLQWWQGLIGDNKCFSPSDYTIICVNLPGSCYGSTGPLSINSETGKPYYNTFPVFSTKDIVKAFGLLRNYLGVQKIHIGIGASMGGQHLLQWAIEEPALFEHIIPIACNARQSAWSLAIDAAQRLAIEADPSFKQEDIKGGEAGMKAARAIAMVHYRTYDSFLQKQSAQGNAESYQRYQADKLAERFNAYSYYTLSLTRSTYDLSRDYSSIQEALRRITAKTLVIGVESDGLFPLPEQQFLAANIANARLFIVHSIYGHDAFLVEYDQLTAAIKDFLGAIKITAANTIHSYT